MPIYDYQCTSCQQRFEQIVKPGETPACPGCGGNEVVRLFTPSAVVSTAKTRERALAGARSRARAVKKEKDHAHREYLQNHIKDHS